MKKNILTNLKYLAFALVLALGTSVLADWISPIAVSPAGNRAVPLHVGPYQVKDSGLSVNGFAAYQNSSFNQHLALKGVVRGGVPTDTTSTVMFGRADAPTNVIISGNVASKLYLQSQSVANNVNKTLCADAGGAIHTCESKDMCLNFDGEQTEVPAGHTQNSLGNCIPNTGLQYITSGYNRFSATTQLASQSDPNGNGIRGDDVLRTISLDTASIVTNQINGFLPSALDQFSGDVGRRIWNVQESGNYKIQFNSTGYIQTYAVRRGNTWVWVDFYMKINGTDIPLAPINAGNSCGTTGGTGLVGVDNIKTQYFLAAACSGNTGRKYTATMYYNLNLDKTVALTAGDTIELYGTMKGWSREDAFLNVFGDYRDWDFKVGTSRTYMEMTKLP